jgi:hypothetical protein
VLSGSEWGNLLMWEGGLIKCEITRKGRKPCHVGAVEFLALDDGEVLSAGADGLVVGFLVKKPPIFSTDFPHLCKNCQGGFVVGRGRDRSG